MVNQLSIEKLVSNTESKNIEQISDHIFKVGTEVIEIVEINYDLKTLKFRHNHNTHFVQYKNNLDITLDKMGIKRSFEIVNTDLKAPMPGKVLQILVKEGDNIQKGDPLLILEAMKMENVLKSESDSCIKSICITALENVEKNQILIEFDTE